MKEQEAKQIATELLERRGDTDVKIHSIYNLSDEHFGAVVSYTWHLNGHPKKVQNTRKTFYKDESDKWKIFGI